MKLYYFPGTCSLAPHIVAREAGLQIDLEKVDITASPRRTESGADYSDINPNGYVPALQLDNGALLTEVAAIVQYLADLAPDSQLAPATDTRERYDLQAWLTFVSSELHKMFSPWLFSPDFGEEPKRIARHKISERLGFLNRHLQSVDFLAGGRFSVADAYAFTIVGWAKLFDMDLSPYPHLERWMEHIAARPGVRGAMRAEGLV